MRGSDHYFFDLGAIRTSQAWTRSDAVQPEIANKLAEGRRWSARLGYLS